VLAPGYEQHFVRAASVYTSEFAGKARMQGIYAGPTHIALLGAFLGLRGWHLWIGGRSRRNAGALIALGGALVYEADVRTAFLVLGVGIVLTMLLRRPREARHAQVLMRTLVVGTILVAIIASGHVHNDALSSIPGLGQDHRATTRLGLWQTGWDYFKQSPLYGLGPGSGSSTMALRFAIGRHVTGDNEYVAILVEGGLIGVAAMFWLFGTIRRHTRDLMSPDHASSSALVCLALFALTGNIFEATPISLILAAFIGLRVTRGGAFDQRDLASPEQLT
jgi:O-antigen ligase